MATTAALRRINQARVLAALRRGSRSRAGLAEELGLNRSTATVIVNALLEAGLVREVEPVSPGGTAGRPRVGVALRGPGAHFAGLDLGNQRLTAAVVDLTGREIASASEPTDAARGPAHAERRLIALLAGLLAAHPDVNLDGLGLTVAGVVSPDGDLERAPWLGWGAARLGDELRAAFGVRLSVENDANAAALAEEQLRPRTEGDNLLFLLLDAGVGSGLLIHRELYRGGAGRVGEAGHIRYPAAGRPVQDALGQVGVLAELGDAGGRKLTWAEALTAIESPTPAVRDVVTRWQDTLGWLAGTLAWALDPDVVVFGGPVSALLRGDADALRRSLRTNGPAGFEQRWRLSARPSDDPAGGAVALALRDFFAVPTLVPR